MTERSPTPIEVPARRGRLGLAAALGLSALALGACGRRGPLEAPPDATAPRPGPVAGTGPAAGTGLARSSGAATRPAVTASPTTLATQSGDVVSTSPDDEGDGEQPAVTVNPSPTPVRRGRGRAYTVPNEPFILDPIL